MQAVSCGENAGSGGVAESIMDTLAQPSRRKAGIVTGGHAGQAHARGRLDRASDHPARSSTRPDRDLSDPILKHQGQRRQEKLLSLRVKSMQQLDLR
jgi:hypothetical protein